MERRVSTMWTADWVGASWRVLARSTMFLVAASWGTATWGQCIEPATVTVEPGAPSTRDSVDVRIAGETSACIPFEEGWELTGQDIVIDVGIGEVCAQVLGPFEFTTALGQLPAGSYTVRYELGGENFCNLEPVPLEVSAAPEIMAGSRPGATLLIPHFAVDLSTPDGPSTFVAVGNAGDEPVIAHAVLWTDWGIPTFSFDLALDGGEVRTFNVRSILTGDLLPVSSGDPVIDCQQPPPPSVVDVLALIAQHTGQPGAGGLCSGSERAGSQTAVGYVTIDVANVCTPRGTYPTTSGYFEQGGNGLASNRNVLWGDYFYVDELDNSAQGLSAVSLVANAEVAGKTFYSRYLGDTSDGRAPLGSTYRARYLSGGGFDGGTDLILWLADGRAVPRPVACDERLQSISPCQALSFKLYDLAGEETGGAEIAPTELSTRLSVGDGDDLATTATAGYLEVSNLEVEACTILPTGFIERVQLWVTPVLTASERFSVGLEATVIE